MILSQPKNPFLGVVFDVDHDFEGPRAPKAHLDTAKEKVGSEKTPRLICRSVITYDTLASKVAWVLTVGVPDMRAAEWEGQELSTAWHLAVRKSVRAVLQAARDEHVTDLMLSNDGCSELANPAAAYFGTVCDLLCSEFAGAFDTVGFAIRAGEPAQVAQCRKALARLLLDAPPPSQGEAGPLADQLHE